MCTFEDDRTVQVCDIAIDAVRRDLESRFASDVTSTHREGEGTLVMAGSQVAAADFRRSAEQAIAAAQEIGAQ